MFQELLFSPIIFLESILSSFFLPKATFVNPVYGNTASGAILSGLAIIGIIPQIESFIGLLMTLISMFVLFCIQTVVDIHNSKKTISIWSNCICLSSYGIVSGVSLSLTSDVEFIKYAASIMISTLAISYSLGYKYIEYVSEFKDKIPIILFSLSTPIGMLLGELFDNKSSDLFLGISAGTFLMFGINNIFNSESSENSLSLGTQPKLNKNLVCFSVFIGFVISAVLQSSTVSNMISETDVLVIESNSTLLLNSTDSNSTELLLNSTLET